MHASTRGFVWRRSLACAVAALLASGTVAAGAASAAPQEDPTAVAVSSTAAPTASPAAATNTPGTAARTPAPTTSGTTAPASTPTATGPASQPAAPAPASPTATAPAPAPSDATLPDGLATAVKRDLGLTAAQYEARGRAAEEAAAIQTEVAKTDPSAVVSVAGDGISVQTTAPDPDLKAAGPAKVTIRVAKAKATPGKATAASVDALFNDYVKTFGIHGLLSVARDASGNFVIRTGARATAPATPLAKPVTLSVSDFAAKYGNVTVKAADGPAQTHFASGAPVRPTFVSGDPYTMVNGQGYYAADAQNANGELCSVGWNGFNKAGKPAVISAGHCTSDGRTRFATLTNPANDTAVTGPDINAPSLLTPLGTIGFSQYGGPGNSPATGFNPDATTLDGVGNIGTDVSVIDNIPSTLTQLPRVARWSNAGSWSPQMPKQIAQDTANVAVTGVGQSVVGAPVCKSGRTTGWTCGTVNEKGIYIIAGINFPSESNPNGNPDDVRAIRGFASINGVTSYFGDSGAPAISGTTAVGMLSGGGASPDRPTITIFSELKTALAATGGYTVKIFLATPAVQAKGAVHPNATIRGTVAGAPAGTTVSVVIGGRKTTAAVNASGMWTATAPASFGRFTLTAKAHNGFSSSASVKATLEVVKPTVPAPTFTQPSRNGSAVAPLTAIAGRGMPGATIMASGDVVGTAVVGADGTWRLPLSPRTGAAGKYRVTIKAVRAGWNDSPAVTSAFAVSPRVPAAAPQGATVAALAAAGGASLASTGAGGTVPLLGMAGGLLLLGGGALALAWRRKL